MGQPRRFRLVRVVLAVSLVGLVLTSAEARGRPPGELNRRGTAGGCQLAAVDGTPRLGGRDRRRQRVRRIRRDLQRLRRGP